MPFIFPEKHCEFFLTHTHPQIPRMGLRHRRASVLSCAWGELPQRFPLSLSLPTLENPPGAEADPARAGGHWGSCRGKGQPGGEEGHRWALLLITTWGLPGWESRSKPRGRVSVRGSSELSLGICHKALSRAEGPRLLGGEVSAGSYWFAVVGEDKETLQITAQSDGPAAWQAP